jgi:hypothetical protein
MNTNELKALFGWCNKIGIRTLRELNGFACRFGCRTNNELLNKLNEMASHGYADMPFGVAV